MKVRKTPFALLLILTFFSTVWEDKAKVIAAVTNEENIISIQSTNENLNAYFTYNENGLYVDGTDPVPLELLSNREGYLSIGFNYDKDWTDQGQDNQDQLGLNQFGLDQSDLWKSLDLGFIKMTLADDPIYWKVVNEKGVYQMSKEELTDSAYIRELLPQTLEGLKGYLVLQKGQNLTLPAKIDLVPFGLNSGESIFCIKDSIHVNNLKYNDKLYQYVLESPKGYSELLVTANYHFKITLPNNRKVEGKITFTKNYSITPLTTSFYLR